MLMVKGVEMKPNKCLEDIERMNTTTRSICDLEGNSVLIVLEDGTNLTDWEDVEDKDDVLYVSEDLSGFTDLKGKYSSFYHLKAVVASGVTNEVKSLESMFAGCWNLKSILALNWDLSNVVDMRNMFSGCYSLKDISSLSDWDVGNVENMEFMFEYCKSLSDIFPLKSWDVGNLRSTECMFASCSSLIDISALKDWDLSNVNPNNYVGMFDRCFVNIHVLKDLDREVLMDRDSLFAGWR